MTIAARHGTGALELRGVRREFGSLAALGGVDLRIEEGEFIALLGPSGCGKSTALNCIAGLLPLTGGSIWLGDRRIDRLKPEERGFGMVFQSYALFPHMTVARNVGFGLAMKGVKKPEATRRVDEALGLVRLQNQAAKLPGQLSGGQQQRVAIARAIVIEPAIVLMDEPLSNLDAKLRLEMRVEIRRIHDTIGSTTIYVTHDQDEALSMADRIVVMRDGVIRQVGTPEDLYERPLHADVADFMGYRNRMPGRVTNVSGPRAEIEVCGTRVEGVVREPVAAGGAAVVSIRPARHPGPRHGHRISRPRLLRHGERVRRDGALLPLRQADRARHDREPRADGRAHPRLCGIGLMGAASHAPRLAEGADDPVPLRIRLAARGLDGTTLMVLPAFVAILALFVYPFCYGLWLSFQPKDGSILGNYARFFSDPFLYDTIGTTLRIALPVTILNLVLAVPIAMRVRLMRRQRLLTTILVLPVTLGTVLVAEGLLNYLGPQGWFNRTLIWLGMISGPVKLTNNYWGVVASLLITGFPFTFLLTLSYVTGIDPALEQAGAVHGASARSRFFRIVLPLILPGLAITFCLSFVQAFAVFPSAVLLGAPAGPTRVISIAAYQAAFEEYDYSLASAIAMVMGLVQLAIVAAVLGGRRLLYRGPVAGTKG